MAAQPLLKTPGKVTLARTKPTRSPLPTFSLRQVLAEAKVPEAMIAELHALKWRNGTPFLTVTEDPKTRRGLEERALLFETISIAQHGDLPKLAAFLRETDPIEPVFLKTWLYDAQRNEDLLEKDRLRRSVEVVRGIEPCPKCGSLQTNTIEMQTRGGDEPMTRMSKCLACQHRW